MPDGSVCLRRRAGGSTGLSIGIQFTVGFRFLARTLPCHHGHGKNRKCPRPPPFPRSGPVRPVFSRRRRQGREARGRVSIFPPLRGRATGERVILGLSIFVMLLSVLLVLLVLMHKGKGGGLSDMFGGGVTSSLGGSSVVERNLDRMTVGLGITWILAVIVLGLLINRGMGL